ncbi:MAG: cytochrome c oxidase subunit II [Pseudomonadota bacterium]
MRSISKRLATAVAMMGTALTGMALSGAAFAQSAAEEAGAVYGRGVPGQLNMQEPVTQVGRQVVDLHNMMLLIMTGISVFVLILLLIVIFRFNKKANPTPATWTHNTRLEMVWTFAPVLILFVIAVPSFKLLVLQEDFENVKPDVVIKATGYQWYWGYEYTESGAAGEPEEAEAIGFDSYMIGLDYAEMTSELEAELAEYGHTPDLWKLAADNPMVVPVDKTVLIQTTGADVIHSWTVPSFGVKADSVPNRLNQTWFHAERVGDYYGQCSELCGRYHAYMPINVKVVSQGAYDNWVACVRETEEPYECTKTMNDGVQVSKAGVDGVAIR